ncbi:hypothetical protein TOPH_08720 [Tolypocladium ophioglossoides CBS 100239]|uniref:Uncharacterized protein n=1 Tax=Tolypocladium ophioglossoides (strain CBS 100239) TaxID=1163406 RepID=A0A0L0MXI1_TOLOC|nr:hypothetical protein TOPH_08720 [Tolypocladium ophioglossoides CBS 100239]
MVASIAPCAIKSDSPQEEWFRSRLAVLSCRFFNLGAVILPCAASLVFVLHGSVGASAQIVAHTSRSFRST